MTSSGGDVGRFFDALSDDYTEVIERCFPRYREMLWALLDYLPYDELPADKPGFKVLELGSGTGNFSTLLCEVFPQGSVHLVDVSGESLEVCRSRLAGRSNVSFHERDFRDLTFANDEFDCILSSIAIHHLTAEEKRELFRNTWKWLRPGGALAFADQFRGASEALYARHIENWRGASLEAGSTEDEFEMWMVHQREHDHHDTLVDQLTWLAEAGFRPVDCVWRFLLWSVVQARKP